MSLLAALLLTGSLADCQWIEPKPSTTEAGREVVVEARLEDGAALAGLEIRVSWPDGRTEVVGVTDSAGNLRFVPTDPGPYRVFAEHAGVELIAPLHAAEPAPRLWIALISTPVGLWLLWRALRRR